jgi:Mn-dependent DtxR family transcriptional regulator
MDRDEAERAASEFDERLQNDAPHRVVELFYKDEDAPVGPIPTLDEMREILNGDSQP